MLIDGDKYKATEVFDNPITLPDSFVGRDNKIGKGNGEAKLYIASKATMRDFFGPEGFKAKCFMLKQDLIAYLRTLQKEYTGPTQPYRAFDSMKALWEERLKLVESLDDIIFFTVSDQPQIAGPRGYVNSNDFGYKLIRELALPLVSYLQMMEFANLAGQKLYYWKLFVDFQLLYEHSKNGPLVFRYGKKNEANAVKEAEQKIAAKAQRIRRGQERYREALLLECPFCPITMVNDERLLIASHIKPWAVSSDDERVDPKNGFMLSPLYDALFDKGFITFTDDKRMLVSKFLSPMNSRRLGLNDGAYYPHLPIDDSRVRYLEFHRASVFKSVGEI